MARVGEEFPLLCPAWGGDIRLISFITEPGPIRKILTHLGEPLEPPPDARRRIPGTGGRGAGIYEVVFGLHRKLSGRFPFAIYSRMASSVIDVVAVLDCRRDPESIAKRLARELR